MVRRRRIVTDDRPVGLAPLALHEFRLQLALRLLLCALLAQSPAARAWARAGAADRQRGGRARGQRNFRDRRRAFSACRTSATFSHACTAAAPTTLLTNGMLFAGRRLETLRSLPRERVTLQISLDSPTPERHDATAARAHGHAPGRASSARAPKASACEWRRRSRATRGRGIPPLPRCAPDRRGGSGDPPRCLARFRNAGRCAGARGFGCLKSPLRRKASIGIRSGPRTPICWSPPKFFRSPSPLPPCAAPSNAKASIGAAWQ